MEVPETAEARLNHAYRCFAFLGVVTLPLGLGALLQACGLINFSMGTIGQDSRGIGETLTRWAYVAGIFLGLPIIVGMLYATIFGIVQAVRFRHPPLIVLSAISIVCGGGLLIVIVNEWDIYNGGPILEYAMDIASGLYVGANVLIPAWWFTKGKRRYSKSLAQE